LAAAGLAPGCLAGKMTGPVKFAAVIPPESMVKNNPLFRGEVGVWDGIRIYSGKRPASPDDPPEGRLLATIRADSSMEFPRWQT